MAETSGPFDPVDPENPQPSEVLTESAWELLTRHLLDGVIGVPGDGALQASASGSTARGIDLAAGQALALGHWYDSSAVKTLTSAANAASANRIDRAVLRLDRSANTVTTELLAGTAGAGAPALTSSATVTDRPLWRWTIKPGDTAATSITDERNWIGSVVRPATSGNRSSNPRLGEINYEQDTGRWVGWSGTAWRSIAPDPPVTEADIDLATKWPASSGLNRVLKIGRSVEATINVVRKSDAYQGIDPQGSPIGTIPAGYRPPVGRWWAVHITPNNYGRLRIESDGGIWLDNPTSRVDVGRVLRATLTYLV